MDYHDIAKELAQYRETLGSYDQQELDKVLQDLYEYAASTDISDQLRLVADGGYQLLQDIEGSND